MMMPPFDTTTYLVDETSLCTSTTVTTTISSSSSTSYGKEDEKLITDIETKECNKLSTEATTMEESLYSEDEYYEESDDGAEDEEFDRYQGREGVGNLSFQKGRYCQFDDRLYNAGGSTNNSEKYSNGNKNGNTSLVGGWLSDFKSLAICIKDTAGEVASFVHTTALTVAHEITMLDDEYQQQQEEEMRLRDQEEEILLIQTQQGQQEEENEMTNPVCEKVTDFRSDRIEEQKQELQEILPGKDKIIATDVACNILFSSNEKSDNVAVSHGSQNSLINVDDIDDDISINSDYYNSDNENETTDTLLPPQTTGSGSNQKFQTAVETTTKDLILFDSILLQVEKDDNDDDSYIFL